MATDFLTGIVAGAFMGALALLVILSMVSKRNIFHVCDKCGAFHIVADTKGLFNFLDNGGKKNDQGNSISGIVHLPEDKKTDKGKD